MRLLKLLTVAMCIFALSHCASAPTGSVDTDIVPEPKLVLYASIPAIETPELYRASGAALADGHEALLKELVDAGFSVLRAWHPNILLCMALFPDEVIVQLATPDTRISDFGFSRDFTLTMGSCATHWDQYDFFRMPNPSDS